jgi:hypothetical protein
MGQLLCDDQRLPLTCLRSTKARMKSKGSNQDKQENKEDKISVG